MLNLRAHVPPLYDMWWVLGSMSWACRSGSDGGIRENLCVCLVGGWGLLIETPKSLGTIIKMAPRFGDEKACLALQVHWRCSPAYLEHPLFMTFYKFQLTFLSVVDVSFCLGYTGCVLSPTRWKYWSNTSGIATAVQVLLRSACLLAFLTVVTTVWIRNKGRIIYQKIT